MGREGPAWWNRSHASCGQRASGPDAAILLQGRPEPVPWRWRASRERCLDPRVSQGFSRELGPGLLPPLSWFLLGGILGFLASAGWGIRDVLVQTPTVQWSQRKCHPRGVSWAPAPAPIPSVTPEVAWPWLMLCRWMMEGGGKAPSIRLLKPYQPRHGRGGP